LKKNQKTAEQLEEEEMQEHFKKGRIWKMPAYS
jgi:hypothetical protein